MKNCMFQYATRHRILVDTDLITQDEAQKFLDKNRQDFIERLNKDEEPQMCVWINCENSRDYGETLYDWCADDFKVIDGELYQRV